MRKVTLQAKVRDTQSKSELKQIRKAGQIAASVYGHGRDSISVSIDLNELAAVVKGEAGLHALIDMNIDGAPKDDSGVVLIKKIQKDPMTRKLVHVDFMRVLMTEKLGTETPIELIGVPVGVQLGGTLEHVIRSLNIRCLPDNIPSHIELDISNMEIGNVLHVSDLPLPEGVEALAAPDEVVVAVRQPTVHVEEVAEEAALAEGEAAPETPAAATEE